MHSRSSRGQGPNIFDAPLVSELPASDGLPALTTVPRSLALQCAETFKDVCPARQGTTVEQASSGLSKVVLAERLCQRCLRQWQGSSASLRLPGDLRQSPSRAVLLSMWIYSGIASRVTDVLNTALTTVTCKLKS